MKEEKQAETLFNTMDNAFKGCEEAAKRLKAFLGKIDGTAKQKCEKFQKIVREWVGSEV